MLAKTKPREFGIVTLITFVATFVMMTVAEHRGFAAVQAPATPKEAPKSARDAQTRRPAKQGILDLEDPIARADLILVVRLADITEAKIVHGGKTEVVTQQFRFEPVRTLKGIFARDSMLLTGQDLGTSQFAAGSSGLERGQLLLLLLARQGAGYLNCNQAGSLEQSIPRLRDQTDPLLSAVEALLAVTQTGDRGAKVAMLLDALRKAKDRDAAPLLISLRRRATFAAQTPEATEIVTRFLGDPASEIREVTARTLAALLDTDYLRQEPIREQAVKAIVAALDAAGPDLSVRVAGLDALGAAGESATRIEPALAWLRADRPATTFAEHAARLRAVGRSGQADQGQVVATYLEQLPLDAPVEAEFAAGRALGRLDPKAAAQQLARRLANKSDAGMPIGTALALIAELPRDAAAPELVAAFDRVETYDEQLAFATACVKVADPRLVASLTVLLAPRFPNVRWQAVEALRRIDTDESARVLWPHLGQEANLLRKLQQAEFLGRHGYRGGYPYAIEHITAPELQDAAVEALAAIQEPKAVPELRKIWESSHDLGWNAAAIRALGRLGQADIAPRLLELAQQKNPLTAPALIALGDLHINKALPLVLDSLGSRNDLVVVAAARAAAKLLADPEARSDEVRDRLAALVADSDSSQAVRKEALESLVVLNDPRLATTLVVAARDGGLEGSELLQRVEELLATRKIKLSPK
ncbi:HEAT repeat domain-containing protein [Singulisphaera sp. Ch08]|uniref:HEAT repeat domain-containing protein n=1 Tax=Singulisphaera sp. Ch08 TaxID=3120278 RepID=A0AAU7CLM5_9BACT